MKSTAQAFGVFLFIALLFVKVSALHTYSHNDTDHIQDCTTCVLSLDNQQETLSVNSTIDFSFTIIQVFDEYNNTYVSTLQKNTLSYFLFGRPPPTATISA